MGKDYTNVILEDMRAKIDAILEFVIPMSKDMQELKQRVSNLEDGMTIVKSDIKAIKASLKMTNIQMQNHKTRITRLETKAA